MATKKVVKKSAKKIRKPSALELLQRRVEAMDQQLVHVTRETHERLDLVNSDVGGTIARVKKIEVANTARGEDKIRIDVAFDAIGEIDSRLIELKSVFSAEVLRLEIVYDDLARKVQSHADRLEKASDANSVAIEELRADTTPDRQFRISAEAALTSRIAKVEEYVGGVDAAHSAQILVIAGRVSTLEKLDTGVEYVDLKLFNAWCADVNYVKTRIEALEKVAQQPVPGDHRTLPEWIDTFNLCLQETRELVDRMAMQPAGDPSRRSITSISKETAWNIFLKDSHGHQDGVLRFMDGIAGVLQYCGIQVTNHR